MNIIPGLLGLAGLLLFVLVLLVCYRVRKHCRQHEVDEHAFQAEFNDHQRAAPRERPSTWTKGAGSCQQIRSNCNL